MIKTAKVVDITELPEDIKKFLREQYRGELSNGSYITHCVMAEYYDGEFNEDYTLFDKYLTEQGLKLDEEVILLYWW